MEMHSVAPLTHTYVHGFDVNVSNPVLQLRDGRLLYASGANAVIHDLVTTTQEFRPVMGSRRITAIAVAPDMTHFAVAEEPTSNDPDDFPAVSVYTMTYESDVLAAEGAEAKPLKPGQHKPKKKSLRPRPPTRLRPKTRKEIQSTLFVSLSFSHDGHYLFAQGGAPGWRLFNWRWKKKVMMFPPVITSDAGGSRLFGTSLCSYPCKTIAVHRPAVVCGQGIFQLYRLVEERTANKKNPSKEPTVRQELKKLPDPFALKVPESSKESRHHADHGGDEPVKDARAEAHAASAAAAAASAALAASEAASKDTFSCHCWLDPYGDWDLNGTAIEDEPDANPDEIRLAVGTEKGHVYLLTGSDGQTVTNLDIPYVFLENSPSVEEEFVMGVFPKSSGGDGSSASASPAMSGAAGGNGGSGGANSLHHPPPPMSLDSKPAAPGGAAGGDDDDSDEEDVGEMRKYVPITAICAFPGGIAVGDKDGYVSMFHWEEDYQPPAEPILVEESEEEEEPVPTKFVSKDEMDRVAAAAEAAGDGTAQTALEVLAAGGDPEAQPAPEGTAAPAAAAVEGEAGPPQGTPEPADGVAVDGAVPVRNEAGDCREPPSMPVVEQISHVRLKKAGDGEDESLMELGESAEELAPVVAAPAAKKKKKKTFFRPPPIQKMKPRSLIFSGRVAIDAHVSSGFKAGPGPVMHLVYSQSSGGAGVICVTENKYLLKINTDPDAGWRHLRDNVLEGAGLLASEITGVSSPSGAEGGADSSAPVGGDQTTGGGGDGAPALKRRRSSIQVQHAGSPGGPGGASPSSPGAPKSPGGTPTILDSGGLITPLMHLKPMRARGMEDASAMFNKAGRPGSNEVFPTHHPGPITCVTTCIWKDMIATAGGGPKDHSVRLWSMSNHSLLEYRYFDEPVLSVSLHPTGLLALVGLPTAVTLQGITSEGMKKEAEFTDVKNCKVCKFSIGGELFAAASQNVVKIFNTYTRAFCGDLKGHNDEITCMVWTSDGASLVTCGQDGSVYQWDVKKRLRVNEHVLKSTKYLAVALSENIHLPECAIPDPDLGRVAIFTGEDRTTRRRMPGTGQLQLGADGFVGELCLVKENTAYALEKHNRLTEMDDVITALAVSRDDRMLIAGTKQGYLCTYALPFNKAYALDVDRVKTHDGRITSLSLSPEGTTLFSSAVDGTVYESCITAYKPMAPPTNDDDDEVEAAEDGSTPAPDPDDEMLHGTVNAVIADDGSLFDQPHVPTLGEVLVSLSDMQDKHKRRDELVIKETDLARELEIHTRRELSLFQERHAELEFEYKGILEGQARDINRETAEIFEIESSQQAIIRRMNEDHDATIAKMRREGEKELVIKLKEREMVQETTRREDQSHAKVHHQKVMVHTEEEQDLVNDQEANFAEKLKHRIEEEMSLKAQMDYYTQYERQEVGDVIVLADNMRDEWADSLAAKKLESEKQRTEQMSHEARYESDLKTLQSLDQKKREQEEKNEEYLKVRKTLQDDQNALRLAIIEEDETIGRAEEETQREKERNNRLQTEKLVLDHKLAGVRNEIEPRDQEILQKRSVLQQLDERLAELDASNRAKGEVIKTRDAVIEQTAADLLVQRKKKINSERWCEVLLAELRAMGTLVGEGDELDAAVRQLHSVYGPGRREAKQQELNQELAKKNFALAHPAKHHSHDHEGASSPSKASPPAVKKAAPVYCPAPDQPLKAGSGVSSEAAKGLEEDTLHELEAQKSHLERTYNDLKELRELNNVTHGQVCQELFSEHTALVKEQKVLLNEKAKVVKSSTADQQATALVAASPGGASTPRARRFSQTAQLVSTRPIPARSGDSWGTSHIRSPQAPGSLTARGTPTPKAAHVMAGSASLPQDMAGRELAMQRQQITRLTNEVEELQSFIETRTPNVGVAGGAPLRLGPLSPSAAADAVLAATSVMAGHKAQLFLDSNGGTRPPTADSSPANFFEVRGSSASAALSKVANNNKADSLKTINQLSPKLLSVGPPPKASRNGKRKPGAGTGAFSAPKPSVRRPHMA